MGRNIGDLTVDLKMNKEMKNEHQEIFLNGPLDLRVGGEHVIIYEMHGSLAHGRNPLTKLSHRTIFIP